MTSQQMKLDHCRIYLHKELVQDAINKQWNLKVPNLGHSIFDFATFSFITKRKKHHLKIDLPNNSINPRLQVILAHRITKEKVIKGYQKTLVPYHSCWRDSWSKSCTYVLMLLTVAIAFIKIEYQNIKSKI